MKLLVLYLLSWSCVCLSLYLIKEHYSDAESSLCDIGKYFSCSKVNKSAWSVLFGVPIASWGALWSLVFFACVMLAQQWQREFVSALVIWLAVGFAFIWYLVLGEYVLESICLFCTVIHVVTVVSFGLAISIYKDKFYRADPLSSLAQLGSVLWKLKNWISLVLLLHTLLYGYYQLYGDNFAKENLARCLTSKGAKLYGNSEDATRRQLLLFGDASKHIYFINCGLNLTRCEDNGILVGKQISNPVWPVWKFTSGQRIDGEVTLKDIASIAKCSLH